MKSIRVLVVCFMRQLADSCKLTCDYVREFTKVAKSAKNDFKLPIIEDVKKNNFVKPGILPKKGGKKNKNVYYGRRY